MILYPGPPKSKGGKKPKLDASPIPGLFDKHVINELANKTYISKKEASKCVQRKLLCLI